MNWLAGLANSRRWCRVNVRVYQHNPIDRGRLGDVFPQRHSQPMSLRQVQQRQRQTLHLRVRLQYRLLPETSEPRFHILKQAPLAQAPRPIRTATPSSGYISGLRPSNVRERAVGKKYLNCCPGFLSLYYLISRGSALDFLNDLSK
jgi:hypothetical protein